MAFSLSLELCNGRIAKPFTMLDPVSAVGVAAATVQFLEFTTKLLATGKEIHDSAHGTTEELVQLDEVYSHLKMISTKLSRSGTPTDGMPQEEKDLCRLATSCQHECEGFMAAIEKLGNKSGSKRAFKSFQQALKIIWNQKAIHTLESRLEKYQRELTLALVTRYGHVYLLPMMSYLLTSGSNGQSSVVSGLQSLIADNRRLEFNQKSQSDRILELLEDIKQGAGRMSSTQFDGQIEMITMKLPEAFHIASDMIRYRRFLQTLYFSSLKARYTRIANAHERTFNWLFQDSDTESERHTHGRHFVSWLRSGDGIFWVSGKPGSGKSTLMKWISSQKKTEEILFQWGNLAWDIEQSHKNPNHWASGKLTTFEPLVENAGGQPASPQPANPVATEAPSGTVASGPARVVMASFYFWSAGTAMQKSQQGLFQSLLYEIFSHAPDLIPQVCPARWQATELGGVQDPWTVNEISDAIQRAICLPGSTTKFCFFIDGIDEYSGDHFEMVRLLEEFSRLPNVKLCLASRPWNVFEDAFGQSPKRKFYLQDLTRGDIEQYVRNKFDQHPMWQSLSHDDTQYNNIATEIIERAQGGFLWVFLVVRSLLDGLTNGDTVSLLQERLRQIPTDLREFFKYILASLDPLYKAHVAHFFLASMDSPEPLPLLMFSFFEEEFDRPDYVHDLDITVLKSKELKNRHKQTKRRLNGRCKGLLEVHRNYWEVDLFDYQIDFLHRTVRDFFMTEEMRHEFESRLPDNLQICISMLKASIAMMKKAPTLRERLSEDSSFWFLVDTALYNARKAELLNGTPTTRLLGEMSYVLDNVGFSDDYWGGTAGDSKDGFLALTIGRGLLLYASQQLQHPASGLIATKKLQLNEQKRPILDCAVFRHNSESFGDIDISDMVLFLLTNGCDPNEVPEGSSRTVFSKFLGLLEWETGNLASYIQSLKHFLTHGANPNYLLPSGPIWATLLRRLYESDNPEAPFSNYLEIIELLLSFGANPNLECKSFCSCCGVFTPWRHFLAWLASLADNGGVKGRPFHHQDFLARICVTMLEHNADPTIRVASQGARWTVGSVIESAFVPALTSLVLAVLPAMPTPTRLYPQATKRKATGGHKRRRDFRRGRWQTREA